MPEIKGKSVCMDNAACLDREQEEFDDDVTAHRRLLQAEFDAMQVTALTEGQINTWLRNRLGQLGRLDLYMHILIKPRQLNTFYEEQLELES